MLLVGDAAGLAYPQSGEGIRPAIESGLLAAATIVEADGDYTRRTDGAVPGKAPRSDSGSARRRPRNWRLCCPVSRQGSCRRCSTCRGLCGICCWIAGSCALTSRLSQFSLPEPRDTLHGESSRRVPPPDCLRFDRRLMSCAASADVLARHSQAGRWGCDMRGLLAAIVVAATTAVQAQIPMDRAKAELKDAQGRTIGMATLTESSYGVLMLVALTDAPEGGHALHIHQTGKCEPPFTTAGAHFNPAGRQHGIENPMGMHAGDLPNIQVPAGGRLTFDLFAPNVTLRSGPNSLLDADGSALVLHRDPDDYKSDPAGNAGDRIGCGVIRK